MAAKLYF